VEEQNVQMILRTNLLLLFEWRMFGLEIIKGNKVIFVVEVLAGLIEVAKKRSCLAG
jgi:hypothetical protein